MKAKVILLTIMLIMGAFTLQAQSDGKKKDKKSDKETVTFVVSMSCENCKKNIERNIPFEKGVTDLIVNLDEKTVTIEYKPKKTNPEKLKAAIEKLGYTVSQPGS